MLSLEHLFSFSSFYQLAAAHLRYSWFSLVHRIYMLKSATPIENRSPVDGFNPHGKSDLYSFQSLHIIAV